MHEIGIVQGALDLALQAAEKAAATRVEIVRMRVGSMTGVVPEALQFAFEALRDGTLAAEAQLEVEVVAARCWCAKCQREFGAEDWLQRCPECQEPSVDVRHGLELELASIEVT
jgi:hydrogenase nickel incorporation protein HypA/HybF